jgi:IS30 family transposase
MKGECAMAKGRCITYEDRLIIEQRMRDGVRVVEIAEELGFNRASIYQELKRSTKPYNADIAQRKTIKQ